MLKDELNAKKEQYRILEEDYKRYMASNVVQQRIIKDAERIWTRVKNIFRAMPPSKNYFLFVGYDYNTISVNNSSLNTVYWTEDWDTIHQMFVFQPKLEYPKGTIESVKHLAESEGMKCHYESKIAYRFMVCKLLTGLVIEG